jgi:glycosyltransferase involved in cell wall biosynthesis
MTKKCLRQINATRFFSVAARDGEKRRRMLLISVHFPPGSATGALRWQKLSRYAYERGWQLDVITLDPASAETLDQRRLAELPPRTNVYGISVRKGWLQRAENAVRQRLRRLRQKTATEKKTPIGGKEDSNRERQVTRLFSVIRSVLSGAYAAWEDFSQYQTWNRDAFGLGLKVHRDAPIDLIVTCGPPHMVHDIGRRLSKEAGIPLVIDFRDPWSQVHRLGDETINLRVWKFFARYYERLAVLQADLVVMNTEPARLRMQSIYAQKKDRIIAVMNGFDEEVLPKSRHGTKFVISYAGAIYLDRDPGVLFASVAHIIRELGLTPDDVGIEMMGYVEEYQGKTIQSIAAEAGIETYVRIFPPGPRDAAMEFLSHASVLVSLPQDNYMAIPSKVFEYMQFDAWLLAMAVPGSATELVLRGTDADIVDPGDIKAISERLRVRYRQFRAGERPGNKKGIEAFSRREQARLLFDTIDRIVVPNG